MAFVDPHRLGPAFKFLHRHQRRNEAGKLEGFRNLDERRLIVCDSKSEDVADALLFLDPRELSVHELMRLGPVAADGSAMIGIAPPQEGQPRIWGLCTRGYLQLTVSIVGPGALELGRGGVTRIGLRGGKIDSGSSDGSWPSLARFLGSANTALWEGVVWAGGSWSPEYVVYPQRVWDLATAIARGGHGGTLLLIPDNDVPLFFSIGIGSGSSTHATTTPFGIR